MKAKLLLDMTGDELSTKLNDLKGELFNLRFQLATGQLDNTAKIQSVKKDIARVKTVLRKRDIRA